MLSELIRCNLSRSRPRLRPCSRSKKRLPTRRNRRRRSDADTKGRWDMLTVNAKILGMDDVLKMVKSLPVEAKKNLVSAMKSEGNYMRGLLKSESMSKVTPISPITQALKKTKKSVWQILGPQMQYWVNEETLELQVGLLQEGPRPIARRVEVLAKKHSRGYRLSVTRAGQASLRKKLLARYRSISNAGAWEMFGGVRAFIPRVGQHPTQAQPTIDEVRARQQEAMAQIIMQRFVQKMKGGRY